MTALAAALALAGGGLAAARQQAAKPPEPAAAPATIQWMEWSDEAFARSSAEKKPILLYVQARWSRGSLWTEQVNFTDPDVVKEVNERWIPIQVDRDRRPDIDMRYQVAVDAIYPGEAGWPMTALLFDNGDVMLGSSAIPLKDRRNRVGLHTLLTRNADQYPTRREKGSTTRELVNFAFRREGTVIREPEFGLAQLEEITKDMIKELDKEHGGFGETARVPLPYCFELAGTVYHRVPRQDILDVLLKSLRGMERGALFDRVGGGFHRSATDTAWRVPEFEKLLNHNAPLLVDYLMGYEITGDPDFRRTAESILDFLLGTLKDPAGGFYLGIWAASKADEPRGDHYAWTEQEFWKTVPPAQERLARTLFNVKPEGDLTIGPPPRSLLYLAMGRKEAAEQLGMTEEDVRKGETEILAALAAARSRRPPLPVEKTIFVDSTASGAIAMFEAWRVLGRRDALEAGAQALDRLLAAVPANGPLLHRVQPPPQPGRDPALANDHLMLARACIAGYEATGQDTYLSAARDLVERAVGLFWDPEGTGFFDTVSDAKAHGYLSVRRRLPNDTAYPALNAQAALVLLRLSLHTGDASYRARGEACLKNLVARVKGFEYRMGGLGLALDAYLRTPTRYVVVGADTDPRTRDLAAAASRIFDPGKVIVRLKPGHDDAEISKLITTRPGGAFVAVCRGQKCSEPAQDEASLKERVTSASGASDAEGGRPER